MSAGTVTVHHDDGAGTRLSRHRVEDIGAGARVTDNGTLVVQQADNTGVMYAAGRWTFAQQEPDQ